MYLRRNISNATVYVLSSNIVFYIPTSPDVGQKRTVLRAEANRLISCEDSELPLAAFTQIYELAWYFYSTLNHQPVACMHILWNILGNRSWIRWRWRGAIAQLLVSSIRSSWKIIDESLRTPAPFRKTNWARSIVIGWESLGVAMRKMQAFQEYFLQQQCRIGYADIYDG